ncbi:MAG: sigma-70 family RNA polymerase sigma factor [Bacteroidota bacterium]
MHMVATEESRIIDQLKDPELKSAAFNLVVRKYQRMLYFHIRRMVGTHEDADDVLQNTFLKAWRAIDRFRADASLKTWLYRIATNEALSHIQKRAKRAFTDIEDLQNDLRHSLSGGPYMDGDTIQQKLQKAIENLPERQKLVFSLRYFEELKYDEIAEILDISVGSLKASFHHAVKKVEKSLTVDG